MRIPRPKRLSYQPKVKAHEGRTEKTDFYNATRWRKCRAAYISAHPLCVECDNNGKKEPAKVVDHIVRLRDGGAPFDWNNLQSLCDSCHAQKSGRERHLKGGNGVKRFES